MDMSNTLTNTGDRLTILDGRRATALGNPQGKKISDVLRRIEEHYATQNTSRWDSDRWTQEIKHVASCSRLHGDVWMDYLWDKRADAEHREATNLAKYNAREKLREQLGPREFTLTYSPSWYEEDEAAQFAMKVAIGRLTQYYKDEIIEFHAVGEYTKEGRSHVHAWYNLSGGRKITDKNFKRAWSHWNPKKKLGKGFEGGHHATIQRVSDFAGYAEKHLEEAWMKVDINNAEDSSETEDSRSCSPRDGTGAAEEC